MKRNYLVSRLWVAMLLVSYSSIAQVQKEFLRDEKKATIVMEQFHDPYAVSMQYEEAPHPTGKAAMRAWLRQRKLEAQKQYPFKPDVTYHHRGVLPAPEILATFSGNNQITSTPLDNHLAVGPLEQVISTINVHMLVASNTGFWQGSYNLAEFFSTIGLDDRFFDPRVIYDPQQDRFILVMMQGSDCEDSQIVLAFSQSNDPKGAWHLYSLDGCPEDDGTFADYPMISITENELFLTYNAVHSDSSWQTGFYGTQIHQINKMSGFNGETLSRTVWTDVSYNGRLLRNICPVRNADETLPTSQYFLSTRNFDFSNDTVFLLHLTGEQNDPDAELNITYRVMVQPYGVPPYAAQTRDSFDTNDARVLDAFELNGRIQWVNNTMDFASGRSAVYHGTILTDEASVTGEGYIVAHPTDYLGYPGIVWTGADPSQHDAIIVMSHCSPTRHPGGSAIYTDGYGQYSDFVSIVEGLRAIDMLQGPIERWGDYVGIQRHYNQPGSVWISCSYGRFGDRNEAWIAKLARVEENVSTDETAAEGTQMIAYPNPVDDNVVLEIDNPEGRDFNVTLFDMTGRPIDVLHDGAPQFPGKLKLAFSMRTLPVGQYVVKVVVDGTLVQTKSVVRS